MERWRARAALELLARERMTNVAGVPDAARARCCATPTFDAFDLSSVQYIIAGGGPITPGLAEEARRRFGAKLATRYSCTEAGIGLGTAFDDPDEDAIVSVGRPHPSVELAIRDDDDRDVGAGRDRRGVPALPRGDVGLLARSGADAGRVHRRRLRAHRRSRLDRRPGPPAARRAQQGDVRARRLQRVSRSRSRACCRRIPTSRRSRSCRAPTT